MTPDTLPAEFQVWYFLLTFFGWPILILVAYFRGWWISGKQASDQHKALHDLYEGQIQAIRGLSQEAIEQREKRIAELLVQYEKRVTETDARWRERFEELMQSREAWKAGAQNLTGLTERIMEAVERGMLTVVQTIARTVEEAVEAAFRKRKI